MLGGLTACVPLVASVPLQEPLAVHALAFVLDQVSVAAVPAATLVGLTAIVTIGAAVCPNSTLKAVDALEATSVSVPANCAVNVPLPPCEGVSAQVAIPLEFVVALQVELPKVSVTVCPDTAVEGMAETSAREATTFTGVPIVPPVGPAFKVRKVMCLPAVQVTFTVLEASAVLAPFVVAVIASLPACPAV